jgi:hypothetical protein
MKNNRLPKAREYAYEAFMLKFMEQELYNNVSSKYAVAKFLKLSQKQQKKILNDETDFNDFIKGAIEDEKEALEKNFQIIFNANEGYSKNITLDTALSLFNTLELDSKQDILKSQSVRDNFIYNIASPFEKSLLDTFEDQCKTKLSDDMLRDVDLLKVANNDEYTQNKKDLASPYIEAFSKLNYQDKNLVLSQDNNYALVDKFIKINDSFNKFFSTNVLFNKTQISLLQDNIETRFHSLPFDAQQWIVNSQENFQSFIKFSAKLQAKIDALDNPTDDEKTKIAIQAYADFNYRNNNGLIKPMQDILNNDTKFDKFFTAMQKKAQAVKTSVLPSMKYPEMSKYIEKQRLENFTKQFTDEMKKRGYVDTEIGVSLAEATEEFNTMSTEKRELLLGKKSLGFKIWYRVIQPFNKHPLTIESFVTKYDPKKSLMQKFGQAVKKLFSRNDVQNSVNLQKDQKLQEFQSEKNRDIPKAEIGINVQNRSSHIEYQDVKKTMEQEHQASNIQTKINDIKTQMKETKPQFISTKFSINREVEDNISDNKPQGATAKNSPDKDINDTYGSTTVLSNQKATKYRDALKQGSRGNKSIIDM